jgi:superfamily II DNA or RNA helicase
MLVLNVFPGCGKSILGAVIAKKLRESGMIDHIVVLSPTCNVAAQWGNNAKRGEPKMPVLTFVDRSL